MRKLLAKLYVQYRLFLLRFFKTEDLYEAHDVLERASSEFKIRPNVHLARILIARELLRRNEIFWE